MSIPTTHPANGLVGLAKQIAMPANFAPQRFPSFPALERTAVMGFTQPANLAIPTGRDTKVLVTRQATYPLWAEVVSNASLYQITYACEASQSTQLQKTSEYTPMPAPYDTRVGTSATHAVVPSASGAASTYPWPILGEDKDLGQVPWIYLPEGWKMYVTFSTPTPVAAPINCKLTYETWTTPGQSLQQLGAGMWNVASGNRGGATSVGIVSPAGGYWCRPIILETNAGAEVTPTETAYLTFTVVAGTAVYTASTTNGGNFAVTGSDAIGMVPLVSPSEFSNSQIPWYACRLTAVGCLFTNVTQVLNKGGTVMAGRIPPQNYNPWTVSKSFINGLHPAEKAFLALETGLYTYCPPSTDMADFFDYVSNTGVTGSPVPLYRLDNTSLVNVAFFTPGSVAEALAINCSWHIEFRTTSALFQVALCGLTLETLHQAQLALSAAGFFFENPSHVAVLKAVVSAAAKYGPMVITAANRYIKNRSKPKPPSPPQQVRTRGKGRKSGKVRVMPKNGPTSVKPTSAQGSGIVPSAKKKMASGLDMFLKQRGAKSVTYSY